MNHGSKFTQMVVHEEHGQKCQLSQGWGVENRHPDNWSWLLDPDVRSGNRSGKWKVESGKWSEVPRMESGE